MQIKCFLLGQNHQYRRLHSNEYEPGVALMQEYNQDVFVGKSDLDFPSQDVHQSLPLQLLRKILTSQIIPMSSHGLGAVLVLGVFDSASIIVSVEASYRLDVDHN